MSPQTQPYTGLEKVNFNLKKLGTPKKTKGINNIISANKKKGKKAQTTTTK